MVFPGRQLSPCAKHPCPLSPPSPGFPAALLAVLLLAILLAMGSCGVSACWEGPPFGPAGVVEERLAGGSLPLQEVCVPARLEHSLTCLGREGPRVAAVGIGKRGGGCDDQLGRL